MKAAKITMYIGAALFGIYSIVSLVLGYTTYAAYLETYGMGQVLPAICEGFFATAGWAFLLFAMGAICGHFERQEDLLAGIDLDDDDEDEDEEDDGIVDAEALKAAEAEAAGIPRAADEEAEESEEAEEAAPATEEAAADEENQK